MPATPIQCPPLSSCTELHRPLLSAALPWQRLVVLGTRIDYVHTTSLARLSSSPQLTPGMAKQAMNGTHDHRCSHMLSLLSSCCTPPLLRQASVKDINHYMQQPCLSREGSHCTEPPESQQAAPLPAKPSPTTQPMWSSLISDGDTARLSICQYQLHVQPLALSNGLQLAARQRARSRHRPRLLLLLLLSCRRLW